MLFKLFTCHIVKKNEDISTISTLYEIFDDELNVLNAVVLV